MNMAIKQPQLKSPPYLLCDWLELKVTPFAGAFSKAAVVEQYHIIIVTVKVFGISCPAFYTSGVAMEIKDQSFWIFPVKMQAVDTYTGFYIKKIFLERDIIFELKILFQFFRFKNEFLLEKINKDGECNNTDDDIPDEGWQRVLVMAFYNIINYLLVFREQYVCGQ